MSIENSQSYITNELVPDRMKETARKKLKLSSTSKKVKHNKGNSQWQSLDASHRQNFIYVIRKNSFLLPRNGQDEEFYTLFFSKCHLHHCGEELFAIFFYSTSTISLLRNICTSILGHNLSLGKLKPCTPNQKQWHFIKWLWKSKSKSK